MLDAALAADVVVSGLSGPTNESLIADLDARRARPNGRPAPVLITGWVGVIIEKQTAGYLNRCGADIIAVNSRTDLAHFPTWRRGWTCRATTSSSPDCRSSSESEQPHPIRSDPSGPVRRSADGAAAGGDRRFLYDRLLDYARAHPERQVRLRPRHRLGEDTFHRMQHHPESLLADVDLPPNFGISHTPIAEQLADTDLLLTVSSTACLEALEAGCRVALPLDLGVHERLGNHVFLDSGLLRTFDQIIADDLAPPEPDWLADYLLADPTRPAAIIADRAEAAAGQRGAAVAGGAPVPLLPDRGDLQPGGGRTAAAFPDRRLRGSGWLAAADGGRQSRRAAAGARPAGPPARLPHGVLR